MTPPALERLVRACLAKDPDDRWQTAQDVKLQLEWMRAEGSSTTGAPGAPSARGKRGAIRARWALVALPVLLVAAYFAGRSTAPNSRYAPPQFERKTYQDQSIFNARFMPDGKTLALSAALRGNRPRLFVIRPDYPEAQMIVDADLHLLGVSSRGELLVLNRARYTGHHRLFRGTLARMPLEGGAPRDIMDDVREADWAPDGESIAIIREVGGRDRLEFPVGKALYEAAGYLSDLRVAPRGDRIAFMEHPAKFDDRGSVNVVDLDGKSRILTGGYWGMEGLAWARDGKSVLFSATTNGSDYVVHEVDLAGRMRATQENVGLVTIHDVAPDGAWAVTRDDLPVRLSFRPAGATDEIDLSWLDSALEPMLTPDAKTVVFTDQSVMAGPNYAVTLRPSTGGAIVRLGEGMGADLSPDGKSVLAILYTTPPRLMSYPTGVGEPKQLDRGGFETITSAEWMNDGSRILVSGNETGKPPRCFLLDPASGKLDPIGAEDIWDGAPAPDGSSFIARTRTGWSVHSMAGVAEGRAIPSMTPRDYLIRWSPDASAVYTFQRGEVPSPVDRINVATGDAKPSRRWGTRPRPAWWESWPPPWRTTCNRSRMASGSTRPSFTRSRTRSRRHRQWR